MDRRQMIRPSRCPRGLPFFRGVPLLALVLLLAASSSGCQIVIGVLMSLGGRPLMDADFKKFTNGKVMEKNGKKVVVLCTAPEETKGDQGAVDLDVIAEVSSKMRQHEIKVIEPHKIQTWIDDNGGEFDDADIVEIGRKFDADYVVHIKLTSFTYKENNSPNWFRGRAAGNVSVVQIDDMAGVKGKKRARTIYDKAFSSTYPVHQPVSEEQVSAAVFRKQFLQRVSDELARFFYDHRPGEDF